MPVFSKSPEIFANLYILKMKETNNSFMGNVEEIFKNNWDYQDGFFNQDGSINMKVHMEGLRKNINVYMQAIKQFGLPKNKDFSLPWFMSDKYIVKK